jgi:MFS transporter, PAT family, beta-lactamase induction signal transducer AmpG
LVNLLSSRRGRRLFFTALYLSEGAPIGFIWWALPTKLRAAGIDVGTITALTSVLVFPWIFKFLWSPLIDCVQTRRWSLRSWILSMQLLMGCSLIPLFFWDLATNLALLVPFLLLHAVAAATQDASIDALAISTVPDTERGSVNGWMQLGMLVGRSALGGGALLLEQRIGPTAVVVLLVAVIWSSSALVLLSRVTPLSTREEGGIRERMRALLTRLGAASRNRASWFGLLFAAIAGSGFEAVGGVAGPFLIDRGLSSEEVGRFFALYSVLAMAAGAIIGGYVADRLGKRATVSVFLLLTAACIFTLAALDAGMPERACEWMVPTMTLLYVCIGLFTASSYALFMEITDPALGATQFSAFMGATNGCESWSTFAVGKTIPAVGYPAAFSLMTVVSLTALPLLRFLSPQSGNTQRTE